MLMSAIGPIFDYREKPHWSRELFHKDHYLRTIDSSQYVRSLETALKVDRSVLNLPKKCTSFVLSLNTALATGNDVIKLGARIHGQCECHCWVAGTDRAWLAEIIAEGRDSKIFRDDHGWESVRSHLREAEDPIVLSYSVCKQFPNRTVAGVVDEDWERMSDAVKWDSAFKALENPELGLQLSPNRWNWPDYYFEPKYTGFDLEALLNV
jgi:hypothetical protein